MITPVLAALALFLADAPAAAPGVAPVPAPAVPAAAPVDPVTAEINALLAPYKGKNGDPLHGKLGFSAGTRTASDGEVVFWVISVEQDTTCRMDLATGAMRCDRGEPHQCRLAIAFGADKLVKAWAVTGPPQVCGGFIGLLKAR